MKCVVDGWFVIVVFVELDWVEWIDCGLCSCDAGVCNLCAGLFSAIKLYVVTIGCEFICEHYCQSLVIESFEHGLERANFMFDVGELLLFCVVSSPLGTDFVYNIFLKSKMIDNHGIIIWRWQAGADVNSICHRLANFRV